MTAENLYIALKMSSYFLDFFIFLFIGLFCIAVLVRILNAKTGEKVSIFELVKEILFSAIFTFIFIFYVGFDYKNPISIWILGFGFIIGIFQSMSIQLYSSRKLYTIIGRHIFALIWGLVVLMTEICFIFVPEYLSVMILFNILNTGILFGLNLLLMMKCMRLRKIINI